MARVKPPKEQTVWETTGVPTPQPLPLAINTRVRFRYPHANGVGGQAAYSYGKIIGYTSTREMGSLDTDNAHPFWGPWWLYFIQIEDDSWLMECGFHVNNLSLHPMWVEEVNSSGSQGAN